MYVDGVVQAVVCVLNFSAGVGGGYVVGCVVGVMCINDGVIVCCCARCRVAAVVVVAVVAVVVCVC